MGQGPRYATLRDYLAVVRANRVLILVITLLFGAAAYAVSKGQEPTYEAEASLNFRDVEEDLETLGVPQSGPSRAVTQLASVNAEFVESPEVARRVRRALKLRAPIDSLLADVTARPEAQTNFVVVQARSGNATQAARLANAFADQASALKQSQERRRLRRIASSVQRETLRRTRALGDRFSQALFQERIARIEALADFAEPVEVVRAAEVPAAPESPKPARNTMLGLLIGLTLGLVAAFVRDSLDLRLRGSRDAQHHVGLPLVGQVRREALGKPPLGRNGAARLDSRDADSFQILRTNLDFLQPNAPLRSIAVTSALPNEGKSTVAAALARAHAAAGRRALLLECDLRRPALADRLGVASSPGLTEYLTGSATPQEVVQSISDREIAARNGRGEEEQLDFVPAGAPHERAGELLGSQRFKDFLGVLSRSYDAVVIDCPPLLTIADTREIVPQVDAVLLCVRAGQTTRSQARAARDALERLPERPTGVVLTGLRPGGDAYEHYEAPYRASTPA